MKFSTRIRQQIDALNRVESDWRSTVGAFCLQAIRENWPYVGGRWPYATGESLAGWQVGEGEGLTVRLSNDVDHHRYTEKGYTSAGPRTARSYRGYDYSATAMGFAEPEIRRITIDIIRRAFDG